MKPAGQNCGKQARASLRPPTALLFALRILYHVREAAWYNRPSGRKRAASAYRPGIIAHQKAVAA
ncbi:hypothetical protein DXC40_01735 [Anaerotruncus colihominis]|uniref:Uncharacterized protein n=1 Tax=Anaerotruncus colihominis TaxID=169435 RepID=A0A3E3IRU5_9FIRM|nr:hypothetical protein DXC40_01735 [Anaerotruncus colihominis]